MATSGSLQGPPRADPGIIGQLRGLEAWAAARGEIPAGEWLTSAQQGGAEHYIQHAPGSERVIKITYPSQYGLTMRLTLLPGLVPKRLSEAISLRPATPLEYLDRLALHNELFGRSVEFPGLVRRRGGLSVVISQIFLSGEKPSIAEIEAFMVANSFRRLGNENAYFRERDHLAVFDAHARNFVLTEGVPVPFDVLPQIVSGRMDALLALW